MSNADASDADGSTERKTDPAQVAPPWTNTGMEINGIPVSRWKWFIPAIIAALAAVIALFVTTLMTAAALGGASVLLASITTAVMYSTGPRQTPTERFSARRSFWEDRLSMPWGVSQAFEEKVHGVRYQYGDGMIEGEDDTVYMIAEMGGVNADEKGRTEAERNTMASSMGQAIDQQIGDFPFRMFTTTETFEPDEIADPFEARSWDDDLLGSSFDFAREMLRDLAEFLRGEDHDAWRPRDTTTYMIAEVRRENVDDFADEAAMEAARTQAGQSDSENDNQSQTQDDESGDRGVAMQMITTIFPTPSGAKSTLSTVWGYVPKIGVFGTIDAALSDDNDGERLESEVREQMRTKLHERMDAIAVEFAGAIGVEKRTEVLGPREATAVLTHYWASDEIDADDVDYRNAAWSHDYSNGPDAPQAGIEQMTPDQFDVERGLVRVGDEYARVYYLYDFPLFPPSMMFRDLITAQNVDFSLTLRADPRDSKAARSEIEHAVPEIQAAGRKTEEEEGELRARDQYDDANVWKTVYDEFRNDNTQPWDFTGYIVVRSDTNDAIAEAEKESKAFRTLDAAKLSALEEACDKVEDILDDTPADTRLYCPRIRQKDAFISAAPVGPDPYDGVADGLKSRVLPGVALGAMYPTCRRTLREPSGIRWGRSKLDGHQVMLDPMKRGGPGHMITFAMSGWGKTHFSGRAGLNWYLRDSQRTMIVADTFGAFESATEVANGTQITIGGDHTINPLDVAPTPEYIRNKNDKYNPYRMAVDNATEFVIQILKAQDKETGHLESLVEETVEEAMWLKGITDDPSTHSNESATIREMFTILNQMDETPGEFIPADNPSKEAKRQKRAKAAELRSHMSAFRDPDDGQSGKYAHLVGQTDDEIRLAGGNWLYLDMSSIEGGDAEQSAILHMLLGQVTNIIKRARAESMFIVDEAHYLLHSDEMASWLQKNARHWRHFDASMWMLSQNPREFIETGDGSSVSRATIVEQCPTVQIGYVPLKDTADMTADELLGAFGVPGGEDSLSEWLQNDAVAGGDARGYSECAIDFKDVDGWVRTKIEAAPFEDLVGRHDPDKPHHGEFDEFVEERYNWGGVAPDDATPETFGVDRTSEPTIPDYVGQATDPRPEVDATEPGDLPVEAIRGVGETRAAALRDEGFGTVIDVQAATYSELMDVHGIGETRAETLSDAADDVTIDGYRDALAEAQDADVDQDDADVATTPNGRAVAATDGGRE